MADAPLDRMVWRAIAPGDWSEFLRSFSGRHESWLVRLGGTLDSLSEYDDYVALRELRLEDGDEAEIVVSVGDGEEPTTLRFCGPRLMQVEQTVDGVERALAIEGRDGELTLRFRTAIAPELVDGPVL